MDKKELIILVRKYLKGNASPEEKDFVEAWYQEAHSSLPIETILSDLEVTQLEEQIFMNIQAKIGVGTTVRRTVRHAASDVVPSRHFIYRRAMAVAAAILVLAGASYLIWRQTANPGIEYANLYSRPGQVQKITLSDGTIAWLNADSRLRFAKNFSGQRSREVFLEGEAYFEVAKDPDHPFLVRTQDLTTHVLGTKFDVKAYPGKAAIEVTLLEGKVMLTAPAVNTVAEKEDTLYLDPDQRASFAGNKLRLQENTAVMAHRSNDSGRGIAATGKQKDPMPALMKETIMDAEGSAAWRNGELVFRQESLRSVMDVLSRKYDIQVKADSFLLDQSITVTIHTMSSDEALMEVTRRLKRQYQKGNAQYDDKVQFRKEGNVYFIE